MAKEIFKIPKYEDLTKQAIKNINEKEYFPKKCRLRLHDNAGRILLGLRERKVPQGMRRDVVHEMNF